MKIYTDVTWKEVEVFSAGLSQEWYERHSECFALFKLPIKRILCKSDEEKLAVSQEMKRAEKYSAASNAVKTQ